MYNNGIDKYKDVDLSFVKKAFWFAKYLRENSNLTVYNIGITKYIANLYVRNDDGEYGHFKIYFKEKYRTYQLDTKPITYEGVADYIDKLWNFARMHFGKNDEPDFKLRFSSDGFIVINPTSLIEPVHWINR